MKRFVSAILSAVMAAAALISSALPVYADDSSKVETEDVTIDVSSASQCDYWGQSFTLEQAVFNASRMTKDSKIIVTYTSDEIVETAGNKYNAELVFQSWDNTTSPNAQEGNIWAKIAPIEYDDTSATYDYESIATAYGTNDFSEVYNIILGSTDRAKITCTGMTITNVKTEKYVEAEEKAGKTSPIIIIAAVVAGIVIAVVVIVIIMNKKSSEAFDVSTGEFISKKDVKEKDK